MKRASPAPAVATALLALVLSGCGGLSDDDRSSAEEAALAAVGSGRVTEVEETDDSETAAYDVEVSLDSGTSIDVELDEEFGVLNQGEIDRELAEGRGSAAEDPRDSGDAAGTSPSGSSAPDDTPSVPPGPPDAPQVVDDDTPLEGDVRRQAVRAARAEVGGGRVDEATFADPDDRHVYEVELEIREGDDDEDVTVELDRDFTVLRVDR